MKNTNNKRIVFILLLTALILVSCGWYQHSKDNQLNTSKSLGLKYLSEENYEEALDSFETAIKIDDSCKAAYIGSADAYIGMKDYGSAIDIAVKGFEKTQDPIFHNKVKEINNLQNLKNPL